MRSGEETSEIVVKIPDNHKFEGYGLCFQQPRYPELSEWECHLFGGKSESMAVVWRPAKGQVPNWFWRKMQYLVFGNLWIKDKTPR